MSPEGFFSSYGYSSSAFSDPAKSGLIYGALSIA
jgi:hypothetical protein